MSDNHRTRGHFLRNLLGGVLLIVLTAVGLIHAQQPGTGRYANTCVTPEYANAHPGLGSDFTCMFVRASFGKFSSPNLGLPNLSALFLLVLMVVIAGLLTRRQYGSE